MQTLFNLGADIMPLTKLHLTLTEQEAACQGRLSESLEQHIEECPQCRNAVNEYGLTKVGLEIAPQNVDSNRGPLLICPVKYDGCGFVGRAQDLDMMYAGDLACRCGNKRLFVLKKTNFAALTENMSLVARTQATELLWAPQD